MSKFKSGSIKRIRISILEKATFRHLNIYRDNDKNNVRVYNQVTGFLIEDSKKDSRNIIFDIHDRYNSLKANSMVNLDVSYHGKYVSNTHRDKTLLDLWIIENVVESEIRQISLPKPTLTFDYTVGNRLKSDVSFKNRKVIVRVDYNVPLDKEFNVTDRTRIEASKPTIDFVLNSGGSCILLSHFGRPKGIDSSLSLNHIIPTVSEVLGRQVKFCSETIGSKALQMSKELLPGEILLMENVRFHEEETKGDKQFAKELSELGDDYINDAFGAAHRSHASTTTICSYIKQHKYFGKLLESEILAIDKVLNTANSPFLVILGGAKISSKIPILRSMLKRADHIIIGGGMVYTFKKALGGKVGKSICEDDYLEFVLEIIEEAKKAGVELHLPIDVVAGDTFSNEANQKVFMADAIDSEYEGMDAGPQTIAYFEKIVRQCNTILWNGPLGVFEFPNFANGTIKLGEVIADQTSKGAFSLVGGGDSVAAVKTFGLDKGMSYVSTGGGAMLECLEGKTLPGVKALLE